MSAESDELSPDDARILALESPSITGHTLKLMVLEPGGEALDVEAIRSAVSGRLASQPRARQRVDTATAKPQWTEDDDFEIANHVRRHSLPDGSDWAGLLDAVSALMAEHLDHSRPLWILDLIGPLADGREVIAARIHHAMADGIAGVQFLRDVLFDPRPESAPRDSPGFHRTQRPGRFTEVRRLPRALHRELGHRTSSSPLDRPVTGARELAFSTAALDEMRAIGCALDDPATVNDVLLAIVAGGLRDWLNTSDTLRVQIPVSLHNRDEVPNDLGNRDSFMNVGLPLQEDDALERLRLIRAQTVTDKQGGDPQELYDFFHALGRFPRIDAAVQRFAGSAREFAVSISNVPGPAEAVTIQDRGVEHFFSSSEPGMHHALRVSAISYDGEMGIGLCSDPQALPGMQVLAEACDTSFLQLRRAALGT